MSHTADPRTDLGADQRGGSPDFPALERQVLERGASDDTFCASIARRDGAPEYVVYDGPRFANGLPHYGHLLTGYVKDICWPGHGLPRTRGSSAKSRMSSASIAGRTWWACSICGRSLISWTRLTAPRCSPPASSAPRTAPASCTRRRPGAFLAQGGHTTMITPAEGAYAFQSRLRRNRSYTGYPPTTRNAVADRARRTQPVSQRRFQANGRAESNGHNRIPRGAGLAVPGRVAHPASASGRRAGRPHPAPHHR